MLYESMQVIRSCSNIPGFNLAAEEYFFSQRRDEILFLYVNSPCVVIGCNQAVLSEADMDFCSVHAIPVLRRMSGGGAVYHDKGNLNYCFIKNRVSGKFPLGSGFLQPIIQVFGEMHVPAGVGKRKDLWLPDGYKISGTASHVGKERELHHGTLLYDTDLEMLQQALSPKQPECNPRAIASVPSPVKNIRVYLSEQGMEAPEADDFFQQITNGFLALYRQKSIDEPTPAETEQIQKIQSNTYDSEKWTYKK
ncbi:MAG: lipoate--protein ligase family protein [Bacteroidales bacterium]|nr:lipoate--protein ligase family protein [Bacteroidales bacterium]